jgi:serine/threonine protein phosphatase PrpC
MHSPAKALSAAFTETDKAFREELDLQRPKRKGQGKNWHPGCTAISALFVNDTLIVANAGDCRAVLCRNGQAIALSKVIISRLDERGPVFSYIINC